MVIYAMVPTSGTKHKQAAAIARFLDFAAGAGQKQGVQPGQLPPGYLPLPASLAAKTRKDAVEVLNQTGATHTPGGTTNPGGRDRLRLIVPDPVALDQPGRFCVAAGGQPGGRRAADQHGAAGARVAGHHHPVRPARRC